MEINLNCNQVITLLTFYIENKLDNSLSRAVKVHLENCPACMEKYNKLKQIFQNFSEIKSKITEDEQVDTDFYNNRQYQTFRENLSAYIDNELSDNENIKIKKIAISNPLARKDLEDFYTFKQLLNSSFNKTKSEMKTDFSKRTMSQIMAGEGERYEFSPFLKLAGLFMLITTIMLIGLINLLNF